MAPVLAIYHYFIALLAIAFYRYPAGQICVIAVTGTSGKTTTTHLIYEILKKAGKKISLISTITAVIGNKKSDIGLHVTTPSPFLLQKLIREAVNQGSQYIVIEASSHGIAQFRMLGTNVKIGVLTNIAHEHLDWHKTFENYVNAKLSLILNSKIAVVNKDDESYNFILKRKSKAELITYSIETDADFRIKN
ncbi:MAG: Mur ligase family protein [Actinobacteria bacterium]|nr:Mur ligase family protein [Actinomycetota bacterium]